MRRSSLFEISSYLVFHSQEDELYIPPGRLRNYDMIVIDEVSQLSHDTWREMAIALGEMCPIPILIFVGDFRQLQPLGGPSLLKDFHGKNCKTE